MGVRIAWNNMLRQGISVPQSSGEATGYVDDNLLNPLRWKTWKSPLRAQDEWVKFDMGGNQSLQFFAVMDAVIHAGGSLKVQANATDVWTSPTIDVTFTVPTVDYTRVWTVWRPSASSLRHVRFYFTNPLLVTAQVSLGAVFAGTYLEPSRSISRNGLSFQRTDSSVQRYAMGGQRSSYTRAKFHTVNGRLPLQTASERNELRRAFETVGSSIPVVFALDPNDASLIFYGTLADTLSAEHDGPDLWGMPIEFTEDIA